MTSREHVRSRTGAVTAGIIALLLIVSPVFCGCLEVEPEELPPPETSPITTIPPATTEPVSTPDMSSNIGSTPPPVAITSLKQTKLYTEQAFPPEVNNAISDFTNGETTDTINGFLRWESVRAKTNQSDASSIREQINHIDYALFNTTIQENISVYIGVSGEQAKRIRNSSVFSENGYIIASDDPSVVYRRLANSGRDSQGYLTMCIIDFRKGSHLLFINATEREFLLPHGGIWDIAGEHTYEQLAFSANSVPRYDDIIPTKVRLISTKEHP
jgi:hypothetical protein